jgi:SPX domain
MKFGEYLKDNKTPEWTIEYMDYDELKSIIKQLEDRSEDAQMSAQSFKQVSLTMSLQTDSRGQPVPERSSSVIFFTSIYTINCFEKTALS